MSLCFFYRAEIFWHRHRRSKQEKSPERAHKRAKIRVSSKSRSSWQLSCSHFFCAAVTANKVGARLDAKVLWRFKLRSHHHKLFIVVFLTAGDRSREWVREICVSIKNHKSHHTVGWRLRKIFCRVGKDESRKSFCHSSEECWEVSQRAENVDQPVEVVLRLALASFSGDLLFPFMSQPEHGKLGISGFFWLGLLFHSRARNTQNCMQWKEKTIYELNWLLRSFFWLVDFSAQLSFFHSIYCV